MVTIGSTSMSDLEPRNMYDMTGWKQISCADSGHIWSKAEEGPFEVASSLTDQDGCYGEPMIFTEWWLNNHPILRNYLKPGKGCTHYKAIDDTAAHRRDDE